MSSPVRPWWRSRRPLRLTLPALLLTAALGLLLGSPRLPAAEPSLRYPYRPVSSAETLRLIEADLAFVRARVEARPGEGLELAALAEAYLRKARASGWSEWYLLAEGAARRSRALLPHYNSGATLVLAEVAAARHDFAEALRLADEVLAFEPTHGGATAVAITSHLARGEPAAVRPAAEALARRLPGAGSLGLLALVDAAEGRDDEARRHFVAAIALEEPGDALASAWLRVQLGRLEVRHGRLDEAAGLYREALRIVPGHPPARLARSEVELRRGRYRRALAGYRRTLDGAADSSAVFDHAALQGIARVRLLQGRKAEAERLWGEAEAILRRDAYSDAFGHRRELARLLLERGRPEDAAEALSLLERELAVRHDGVTRELHAWALLRLGRVAEARRAVEAALAGGFREAGLLYRAALVEEAAGRSEAARELERQARELDPGFARERLQRFVLGGV